MMMKFHVCIKAIVELFSNVTKIACLSNDKIEQNGSLDKIEQNGFLDKIEQNGFKNYLLTLK